MRRILSIAVIMLVTAGVAGAQENENADNLFGPRYSECSIDEFDALVNGLAGRNGAVEVKVPGIFKNRIRKEMMKTAARRSCAGDEYIKKMAGGLRDVFFLSYEKCDRRLRDSVNRTMYTMIRPEPADYRRDSCYVYGIRKYGCSDTIAVLLMHMASFNTIIYMTGSFPYTAKR